MMKKMILLATSVLMMASVVHAASEVLGGVTWYYSTTSNDGNICAQIVSGSTKYAGELTIPSSLGGYPVVFIGNSAFRDCTGLTAINIPESVKKIWGHAFRGCSGLVSVRIPESVTYIESYAFYGCSGIKSMTMPSSLTFVGVYAFCGCKGLTSVTIPSGVTRYGISNYAFEDCSGLESVVIDEGVTLIGNGAFSGCSALASVTIPSSVTSIGSGAFSDCSSLIEVTIPMGVTSIDTSTFSSCGGLTEVKIPSSVTSIGDVAFYGCRNLKSVIIPDSVKSIGVSAFGYCSKLTEVIIPDGVTSIGRAAFESCGALDFVEISASVTSIGVGVFDNCYELTRIMVDVDNPVYSERDNCLVSTEDMTLIAVPLGCKSVKLPDGVTVIPGSKFYSDNNLQSVTIPSSVTSIGIDAFCGCSGLKSITLPSGVTSIGVDAFKYCGMLKFVEFLGAPPNGISNSGLLGADIVRYPREYAAEWKKIINQGLVRFYGFARDDSPIVEILSAAIRGNDSTIMDVTYKVTCANPLVRVRALAFQDAERCFTKVVRPMEFIEGTAANIGDAIAANVEHKLSWRVSTDWKVDLAKVKFEVLASAGDLLPLELTTIPKTSNHAAMEISWNAIVESQVFDALLWLYADGDAGLTLSNGVLKNGSTQLADGASISSVAAVGYVYSKMGFSVLSGDELKYAKEITRLGLNPSGVRQYAYRMVEE